MSAMLRDLRHGIRMLLSKPGFSATEVGCVAKTQERRWAFGSPSRSAPFSGSDSEQHAHEPRLAGRIFLCYPPDSALPNHVDRFDTL
jgi:hypothetical protein